MTMPSHVGQLPNAAAARRRDGNLRSHKKCISDYQQT